MDGYLIDAHQKWLVFLQENDLLNKRLICICEKTIITVSRSLNQSSTKTAEHSFLAPFRPCWCVRLSCCRDRFRDQYDDFYTAFRAFDEQHKGYLSVGDVQNMLIKCSYYLNNEQIAELLARWVSKGLRCQQQCSLSVPFCRSCCKLPHSSLNNNSNKGRKCLVSS